MPYAAAADVEVYLNQAFEGEQEDAATVLVAAASDYADRVAGRTWIAGTVTGEVRTVRSGRIRLTRVPVAGVTSLAVRAPSLGASVTTLTSPTGYELIDAATGLILLAASDGDLATVTYTTAPVVPADIKAAVVMLAAAWLGPGLDATGLTFQKIKAGSAELVYRDTDLPVPPGVREILARYSSGLVFA